MPMHHKSFLLPESTAHFERPRPFHTEHRIINLRVDLERRKIEGSCTLIVKPTGPELESLALDGCGLAVTAVELDRTHCPFESDNHVITLLPDSPIEGTHEIKVSYSVSPTKGLYFVGPDTEHPDKNVEAWTHSEPEAARYWFPCFDYPNDRSTSETIITVPEGNVVVSNGKLISSVTKDGWSTFHWKEGTPHVTYLTSFIVGKFSLAKETASGLELQYYYPEQKEEAVKRLFGETPTILKFLEEVTGMKYPYEKYAQTTVESFIAGGEENISATTLSTDYYPDKRSEPDFQVWYSLQTSSQVAVIAHELADQWFGDLVTCRSWSHVWLSEGFATYFQALFSERSRGKDYFRWEMSVLAENCFDEDEREYRRPIVENQFVYASDLFDTTTYQKGAWMLHELRFLLGDETFFAGVARYLKDFAGKIADTHDFMCTMEAASGASLEKFFEQAFYEPGYPEFQLKYSWDRAHSLASVSVKQIQKDVGTPVFRLPVELEFYTAKGRKLFRVEITAPDQVFTTELDSRPIIVEFDPRNWLLKKCEFPKNLSLFANQLASSEEAAAGHKLLLSSER